MPLASLTWIKPLELIDLMFMSASYLKLYLVTLPTAWDEEEKPSLEEGYCY
jgi:hypothetical protein